MLACVTINFCLIVDLKYRPVIMHYTDLNGKQLIKVSMNNLCLLLTLSIFDIFMISIAHCY